jgi:hypothetical protein
MEDSGGGRPQLSETEQTWSAVMDLKNARPRGKPMLELAVLMRAFDYIIFVVGWELGSDHIDVSLVNHHDKKKYKLIT